MVRCRVWTGCLPLLLLVPLRAEPVVLADCETVTGWKANAPGTVAAASDAGAGHGALQIGLPGTVVHEIAGRATPAGNDVPSIESRESPVNGWRRQGCFKLAMTC